MISGTVNNFTQALLSLAGEVLLWLPRLLTFAVILIVGYIIARIVRTLLTKGLRAIHFDDIANRAGVTRALQLAGTRLDAAAVLGYVVFWWIFLAFIEMAVNSLGLLEITAFINSILNYLPNVFVAVLILIVGSLIANVVAGIVRGAAGEAGLSTSGLLADVARWAILIFAFLAALTQLNVASNMIFILFAALVGMLALAGGLAFGLGGVDTARGLLAGQTSNSLLQPGQRVQIGQQMGTVIRHDMNSTVVDTGNGQVSIPNVELSHERITVLNSNGAAGTDNGIQPQQPRPTVGAR